MYFANGKVSVVYGEKEKERDVRISWACERCVGESQGERVPYIVGVIVTVKGKEGKL